MGNNAFNKAIGIKIRKARKNIGLSMAELGKLVNLHESTVQRYEDGEIKSLDVEKLTEFANALRVSSAYLMGWDKDNPIERDSPTKSDLELLARFHNLSPLAQQTVLNLISSLENMDAQSEQAAGSEAR